ncbi:hypothetical protein GCM10009745_65730 [Kribbella yunnanensis]|uniref:WXG100 family type VII secretion target n=1 Tax=Kribbella yunnanensis TaxID=190194 RepID=A0ABN2INQ3_9ACTN
MQEATALFGPTLQVRDVLESFLGDQILVEDWAATLGSASARFDELGTRWHDNSITQLAERLDVLTARGLDEEITLVKSVAADVAQLLDQVSVPGLPDPSSGDWRF